MQERETRTGWLDLALDIDNSMGFDLGLLEQETRFARQQPRLAVFALTIEQMSRGLSHHELGGLRIGLKSKFFRDESDIHIGFVSTNSNKSVCADNFHDDQGSLTL